MMVLITYYFTYYRDVMFNTTEVQDSNLDLEAGFAKVHCGVSLTSHILGLYAKEW